MEQTRTRGGNKQDSASCGADIILCVAMAENDMIENRPTAPRDIQLEISVAPSNRAKCQYCKEPIHQGASRVGFPSRRNNITVRIASLNMHPGPSFALRVLTAGTFESPLRTGGEVPSSPVLCVSLSRRGLCSNWPCKMQGHGH